MRDTAMITIELEKLKGCEAGRIFYGNYAEFKNFLETMYESRNPCYSVLHDVEETVWYNKDVKFDEHFKHCDLNISDDVIEEYCDEYYYLRLALEKIENGTFNFEWLKEKLPKVFSREDWIYRVIDIE